MRRAVRLAVLVCALAPGLAGTALAGFSGTDLFLPMVGRQAGVHPSNWYTTVWIYNPGAEAGDGQALPARARHLQPVAAVGRRRWSRPATPRRSTTSSRRCSTCRCSGALRVTCPTQKLVVTSRVYSKARGAGEKDSVGQDFAAVPASFAIGMGEKTQVLGVHQTLPSADSELPLQLRLRRDHRALGDRAGDRAATPTATFRAPRTSRCGRARSGRWRSRTTSRRSRPRTRGSRSR